VRAAIAAIADTRIPVRASIGIAAIQPQADKRDVTQALEAMLDQADRALYAAKRAGRDGCAISTTPGRRRPSAAP